MRVASKQQLLSNFDSDTGPFFNKIVKASTIYLSSLISCYLLGYHTGIGEIKSIQFGLLCERSPSKNVRYILKAEIKIEDAVRTIDVIESYI